MSSIEPCFVNDDDDDDDDDDVGLSFGLPLVSALTVQVEKEIVLREFNEVSNTIREARDLGPSIARIPTSDSSCCCIRV